MGEVGGGFNERKNEITRKSRMCPVENDPLLGWNMYEGSSKLSECKSRDMVYFDSPKKKYHNNETLAIHATRSTKTRFEYGDSKFDPINSSVVAWYQIMSPI